MGSRRAGAGRRVVAGRRGWSTLKEFFSSERSALWDDVRDAATLAAMGLAMGLMWWYAWMAPAGQ